MSIQLEHKTVSYIPFMRTLAETIQLTRTPCEILKSRLIQFTFIETDTNDVHVRDFRYHHHKVQID